MKNHTVIYFAAGFLTFAGSALVAGDEPSWSRNPHGDRPFDRYFVGVGAAEFKNESGRQEARKTARDLALAAMAREITVTVTAKTKETILGEVHGGKEKWSTAFDEIISTAAHLELRLAEVKDEHADRRMGRPDICYVRVVMDRADVAARLFEELQRSGGEVTRRVEAAKAALDNGEALAVSYFGLGRSSYTGRFEAALR
ncbi:MAG: hypothetical protein HYU36_13795 [Planctomycetes bacterium]|nr:hypothetical protein [Planctomycetota bacterium]